MLHTLQPSYAVPIGVAVLTPLVFGWSPVLGVLIGLFALFLTWQAATLRIVFTPTAFEVGRSGVLIVSFPYADWISWRVFWRGFPVLLYFREVKSIHFIPVLFDGKALVEHLEHFVGKER
ncbi:DUF3119 family protein [Anthocerotibacter panamensis]|uniref:DUF3119 family protein n=1 Tax=Anthocerotibacter panamensis TaxID=2857077 RepID=UPI001C404ED3|nr:DUF3119 family protein [Anthocerotibacter panamensis]